MITALLILAAIFIIGGFLFALFNMSKMVDVRNDFRSGFKRHLLAMASVFIGGCCGMAAFILFALDKFS